MCLCVGCVSGFSLGLGFVVLSVSYSDVRCVVCVGAGECGGIVYVKVSKCGIAIGGVCVVGDGVDSSHDGE